MGQAAAEPRAGSAGAPGYARHRPEQHLEMDYARMPALPQSRFVIGNAKLTAAQLR
jgi:hypothetical protein